LLHAAVPAGIESRRLISMLPEFLLLAGGGVAWLSRRTSFRWAAYALTAAMVCGFLFQSFSAPWKDGNRLSEAAAKILSLQPDRGGVVFVSGSTSGEGSFIAEVAMRERRPGHYVLRGTKMLVKSGWAGHDQKPVFGGSRQVAEMLDNWGVNAIAIESGAGGDSLSRSILLEAIAAARAKWVEVPLSPAAEGRVRLLVRNGPRIAPKGDFQLDLTHTLGRMLSE